jgi:acyl carrier protein
MTTSDRVKQIIAEHLGYNLEDVKDYTNLNNDLDADSLDLIEILMELEDEFGSEISDDDAEKIGPVVSDIVSAVVARS